MSEMKAAYSGEIQVRFADTDANGHMYFANYLVLADEVAGEYWKRLGWDYGCLHDLPALTFTVNTNIDFISECLAGDMLSVGVAITRIGRSSLTMSLEISNQRNGLLSATGTFTTVFVDKVTRSSISIPESFRIAACQAQPELGDAGG